MTDTEKGIEIMKICSSVYNSCIFYIRVIKVYIYIYYVFFPVAVSWVV